jgi:hypothetical protein
VATGAGGAGVLIAHSSTKEGLHGILPVDGETFSPSDWELHCVGTVIWWRFAWLLFNVNPNDVTYNLPMPLRDEFPKQNAYELDRILTHPFHPLRK